MQERYSKEVANTILTRCGLTEVFDVREGGVFVRDEFEAHDLAEKMFLWTPSCDMDWPNSPDPMSEPSLPIPFTAADLAAFMLDGVGRSVQDLFGPIDTGPDQRVLERLGMKATKVRKALLEAYELARRAQLVVGKLDNKLQARSHALEHKMDDKNVQANARERVFEPGISVDEARLRRERAKASIASFEVKASQVMAQAQKSLAVWRRAMVCQLLQPQEIAPITAHMEANGVSGDDSPQPVPAPEAETARPQPAGPAVQKASPRKLLRRDLLAPLIERAQGKCSDPLDAPAVFAELLKMAAAKEKPFIGGITEDGIQWTGSNDEIKFLSLKNLRERLHRQKNKNRTPLR
jgi:hypothetical protein